MKTETFDIEIKLGERSPATRVNDLTHEQMRELKTVFDAATVAGEKAWYMVGNHLPAGDQACAPSLPTRRASLWRRVAAWLTGACVIIACLAGPVFAQERLSPRAVAPIRVALTLEEAERAGDFNEQLRVELNNLRRVAFISNAVDFDIYVTAGPIVAGEKTIGYVSAVAVVTAKAKDKPISVMVVMGPTPADTARRTARRINEEFFEKASR